jgi:hypothetical protein
VTLGEAAAGLEAATRWESWGPIAEGGGVAPGRSRRQYRQKIASS